LEPPPALRLSQKDEGEPEVDILIENEACVWVVEAKYRSDVSERTTNNPERDQVLRNLDVGSWYAGVRDFFFSLLVVEERTSSLGRRLLKDYSASRDAILRKLPHRKDGLINLKGIGFLRWSDCDSVLHECASEVGHDDERSAASRAVAWLQTKVWVPEILGTEFRKF